MKMARSESAHPTRVPVSSNRAPLAVRGLDQSRYVARFVNDVEDRIARFIEGGYQFVSRDKDGNISIGEATAGTSSAVDSRIKKAVGRGVVAYLLALPRELYEEDQAAKQREIDEIEDSIKRPTKKSGPLSNDIDHGRVSIANRRGRRDTPENTISFSKEPTT